MDSTQGSLKLAREGAGWSQEQAIVRFEAIGKAMGIPVPLRASLRTMFSMFENSHRPVPERYRPVFRELYRATDEELGFRTARNGFSITDLPLLPVDDGMAPSPEVLSYLSNLLAVQVEADAVLGPRYLIAPIQSQLALAGQVSEMFRGSDRRLALAVGVRLAEFCGWLYQDSGDAKSAVSWTSVSLDYAHELNDAQLVSYVLMRKSNIATEFGTPGHGLGLADAALDRDDALTPRMKAVCLRQKANAHARLSERREFEATIDQALEAADLGARQEVQDQAPYCTPSYVEMEAGMSRVELGQEEAAIEIFEQSLAEWPGDTQARDRGICLARLAVAASAVGHAERACEVGSQALAIAKSTGSARVRRHLAVTFDNLSAAGGNATVREFRDGLVKFLYPDRAGHR